MSLAGRKVLVTGAGGFIGSHLVEALLDVGATVAAVVRYNSRADLGMLAELSAERRREIEILAGDVRDPFFVEHATMGRAVVFHLAALIGIPFSYVAPESYVATNISGTLNVLEAARKHGARVIHTSTSECYGTARYTPIDERHPLIGQSPYSASKIGGDKMAESYHRAFGLPVVTVRPFNTFGPRQSARAVIPTIVSQALARDEVRLGDLSPVRDMNFVTDTAAGFVAAACTDRALGETVNLASGRGVTIADIARIAFEKVGRECPIVRDEHRVRPVDSEVFELIGDAAKARALLGWESRVSLEDGIGRVVEYVRAHPGRYRPDEYHV